MHLFNIFREVLVEQVVKTIDEDQMTAYHGSPYSFDKFSTDYMGTGEGAQAFGWGLYFTNLEEIARVYANNLYDKSKLEEINKRLSEISKELDKYRTGEYGKYNSPIGYELKKEYDDLINSRQSEIRKNKTLYKVSLHKGKTPDQYTWLDWDIPVSEKTVETILKYLKSNGVMFQVSNIDGIGRVVTPFGTEAFLKFKTGEDIYNALKTLLRKDKNTIESPREVSLFLLRAGIDGIRFPSNSIAGGKTRDNTRGFNYVVFDENVIDVEEKTKFE